MEAVVRQLMSNELVPYDLIYMADPSKESVDDYLSRGTCYVASISGEIAGVCVLLRTRPGTIEIVNIAVKEAYQGKGIGKMLIFHAVETAKKGRAKSIEIGTGNSSVNQLALYQKCGFRIVGIDHDFFMRHYEEEIFENGIQCRDMIRLRLNLKDGHDSIS